MGLGISFLAWKEIQTITAHNCSTNRWTPSKSANCNPSHTSSYPIAKLAIWPHLLTSSCTTPEKFLSSRVPFWSKMRVYWIFRHFKTSTIPYNQLHPATHTNCNSISWRASDLPNPSFPWCVVESDYWESSDLAEAQRQKDSTINRRFEGNLRLEFMRRNEIQISIKPIS